MIQKKFSAVAPQTFTSDGDSEGNLAVTDSTLFKVQQIILLKSSSQQPRELQIKRISSSTEIRVGRSGAPIHDGIDISDFLVADGATIELREQDRPAIPPDAFNRAVFDEEPTVALRTTAVDALGNKYTSTNPMPVQLPSGSLELDVKLTHLDNYPNPTDVADSIRIGDGTNEATMTKAASGDVVGMDTVRKNSVFTKPYDKITILTKNDDGDPLTIRTQYAGVDVQLATISYDADGDFEDVEVSDL